MQIKSECKWSAGSEITQNSYKNVLKTKMYSRFKDNILVPDLANMESLSTFSCCVKCLLCVIDVITIYT